jgi:hypothetical protein
MRKDSNSADFQPKLNVVQSSFRGGMNLMGDDTKIAENEYRECFNLFSRFDRLTPIRDSIEIGFDIANPKQGEYAVGPYIITFGGGKAYYRRYNQTVNNPILSFNMSAIADRIYACAVPASYVNVTRNKLQIPKAFDGNVDDNLNPNNNVLFGVSSFTASPQGLVCQDGISQPRLIYLDPSLGTPTSKVLQTYDEWALETNDGLREYVPIGLDMLYFDGVLFIISPDRTKLLRSLVGRALDFVINVDETGTKGGDAYTTNYAVGSSKLVAIWTASGQPGFIVTTENNSSFVVVPNYDTTIFGEPTFNNVFLFGTGPLNSFCVVDILGDTAFIDAEGIKSFNGAKQNKLDSNNSIFSLRISSLFETPEETVDSVIQNSNGSSAIVFNGYALFSVNTIYGQLIVMFDTYSQTWVCMLKFPQLTSGVKQFASLLPNARKLYGITTDNKMFDMFTSDTLVEGSVVTRAFANTTLKVDQKLEDLRIVISKQSTDGIITAIPIVDEEIFTGIGRSIKGQNKINRPKFTFAMPKIGFKCSYKIQWTGGGSLTYLQHTASNIGGEQAQKESSQVI